MAKTSRARVVSGSSRPYHSGSRELDNEPLPEIALSDPMTTVYKLFDVKSRLLYVGVTGRDVERLREHAKAKEWWPLVARAEFEHFPTRTRAIWREAFLIRRLAPLFNVVQSKLAPAERLREALDPPKMPWDDDGHQVVDEDDLREAFAAAVQRELGMSLDALKRELRRRTIRADDPRLKAITRKLASFYYAPPDLRLRAWCVHCDSRYQATRAGLCKRCWDYQKRHGGELPPKEVLRASAARLLDRMTRS